MSRVRWAATIGFATGIVGLVFTSVPPVAALEQSVGLPWLLSARGAIPPPHHVAIVTIDEATATRMGLPPAVREWPRATHAALVDRLVQRGASAIAFDIQFFRQGDSHADQAFANSIARAARVVLVQRLDAARTGGIDHWERQDPIPLLASQALGLAPVPMPDVPLVSWFWSFLPTPNADDIPTLPAVMLQVQAMPVTGTLLAILERAGVPGLESLPRTAADIREPADLLRLMQVLRRQIPLRAAAASKGVAEYVADGHSGLLPEQVPVLAALVDLYTGSGVRHLNFYGPPGRICTIPYDVVLSETSGSSCQLQGAVVFVGLGSARVARTGQPDTYHTVYPASDGVDFSGVEIHATALANLLSGTMLRPIESSALVVALILIGVTFGSTVYWVRTRRRWTKGAAASRLHASAAAFVVSIVYCSVVYVAFRQYHTVLPLMVPLLVQLPVALVLGLLAPPARHQEQVRAVCLATDAGGSTAVGQRLPHGPYTRLMDDYREMLVTALRAHGGEPVPPEGDGLICLWRCPSPTEGDDEAVRLQACRAALAVAAAAERFNAQQPPDRQLPTRIGLNLGTVTVYSDADRGVFEVFGDTINVAARLRDADRELGSRILASEPVVAGFASAIALRPTAAGFSLKGIASPPAVVELL